jgi:hypothetical protein
MASDEHDYRIDSIREINRRSNSKIIDKILLGHLDDTAIITYCAGEWGNQYTYVSDYYLDRINRRRGKTEISNSVLADEVLRNHNYLHCALRFLEADVTDSRKYYSAIKQIANRNNFFTNYEKFQILSILSAYKKPDDVPFIAERLSRAWGEHDDGAFDLIRKNPDTAYFKILEKYYSILSRRKTWDYSKVTFMGTWEKIRDNYEPFLSALLAYKNQRSADIAADIIKRQLYPPGDSLRKESNEELMYSLLKENECPAYSELIRLLKPTADY